MLRIKLFKWFAALVLIFGVVSAFLGISMIGRRTIQEAQNRVRLDLNSAWDVYTEQLRDIETIVKLTASRSSLIEACSRQQWNDRESWEWIRGQLSKVRSEFGLDFLGVISPEGKVVLRTTPPYATGDFRLDDPFAAKALAGQPSSGTAVYSREQLQREADGLADRAFFVLQDTPYAKPTPRQFEDRGLVMVAAAPIEQNGKVLGAIYAGMLLNRRHAFVDRVNRTVYEDEQYKGVPLGTVTVFLGDTRVSTTVRMANGNRAYGTRVSREVAERVLDNGQAWVGRAFVVRDWYLTAYEPIRDVRGEVIGMLYVGILERPFRDLSRSIILRYSLLSAGGLLLALIIAFVIAGKLARPLHQLAEAAQCMRAGERPVPLPEDGSCKETTDLIRAFNEMASALAERERQLKAANEKLAAANASLTELNRDYMQAVEFVSHELKNPIASMVNYVYMLSHKLLGPTTEKQDRALQSLETNLKRLTEMTRHYLNLARIENGELQPMPTRISLLEDVLHPLLVSMEADIRARNMRVENHVGPDVVLRSDLNMTREVFENLISNAIKYGRDGGLITVSCRPCDRMVECAVRNEGEGIPADKMDQLFRKFSQVDGAAARKPLGTGLGLFICKQIVQAHGGTISAESRPGEWAEFRFTLPSYREEPQHTDESSSSRKRDYPLGHP